MDYFDFNEWIHTEESTPEPEVEVQPDVQNSEGEKSTEGESTEAKKSKHKRKREDRRDPEGKKSKGGERSENSIPLPDPVSPHPLPYSSDSYTTSDYITYSSTSYFSHTDFVLPYDPLISSNPDLPSYSINEVYTYPDLFLNHPHQSFALNSIPASTPPPTSTSERIPNSRGRRTGKDKNPRRTYRCEFSGCTDIFGRKDHLDRHNLAHLNARPFECPTCGNLFSRLDNMNTHRRNVHGET